MRSEQGRGQEGDAVTVWGHGHSSLSLPPAGAAPSPPRGAGFWVAILGCPSRGGYFGVRAVPTSGNVARKGEDSRAQGPSITPDIPSAAGWS